MIKYYWTSFLQYLGYRMVWYFPSRHMPMADFYVWEYRPDISKGVYTMDNLPKRNFV